MTTNGTSDESGRSSAISGLNFLELAQQAQEKGEVFRVDLIRAAREGIARGLGLYDDSDKIDRVIDRLLSEVF